MDLVEVLAAHLTTPIGSSPLSQIGNPLAKTLGIASASADINASAKAFTSPAAHQGSRFQMLAQQPGDVLARRSASACGR